MIKATMRNMSIKRKLIFVMMLTSGIALLMTVVAFVVNDLMEIGAGERQKMTALAEVISRNMAAAVMFDDRKAATDTLRGLSINPHITVAYVVTEGHSEFVSYRGSGSRDHGAPLRMKSAAEVIREAHAESRLQVWEWDDDLEVVAPIILDGQEIGAVVIQSDLNVLRDRITREVALVAGIFLFAVIMSYVIASRLQRMISEPILQMAGMMDTVSRNKDYSVRAATLNNDETGLLVAGFNDMLAQIERRDEELENISLELKESNEELKAFIYSAAHDLRQPLVNIKGFTAELRRSIGEIRDIVARYDGHCSAEDGERLNRVLELDVREAEGYIGSSVERMSSLINALMRISQAGHRALKREPISMNDLARSLVAGAAHLIREQGAAVMVGDIPDVAADRSAVEQILGNILDNALKYLDKERPGRVEINGERIGDWVVIRVRDNGRGIGANDLPRLFQIFRRLGKRDVPGEGVGLAHVKALVKRHDGRIWCESQPGVGTTFSFTLPVSDNAAL